MRHLTAGDTFFYIFSSFVSNPVPDMTYNVFGGTLKPAQLNQSSCLPS